MTHDYNPYPRMIYVPSTGRSYIETGDLMRDRAERDKAEDLPAGTRVGDVLRARMDRDGCDESGPMQSTDAGTKTAAPESPRATAVRLTFDAFVGRTLKAFAANMATFQDGPGLGRQMDLRVVGPSEDDVRAMTGALLDARHRGMEAGRQQERVDAFMRAREAEAKAEAVAREAKTAKREAQKAKRRKKAKRR